MSTVQTELERLTVHFTISNKVLQKQNKTSLPFVLPNPVRQVAPPVCVTPVRSCRKRVCGSGV